MNTARRFRWLPRFSIGNLLMLMVVVGLCLAWYDQRRKLGEQAEVVEALQLEAKRLTVNNILASDQTDDEKLGALAEFVRLGDSVDALEEWCGGRHDTTYKGKPLVLFAHCDLAVQCGEDGRIRSFGCYRMEWISNHFRDHVYWPLTGEDKASVSADNNEQQPSHLLP